MIPVLIGAGYPALRAETPLMIVIAIPILIAHGFSLAGAFRFDRNLMFHRSLNGINDAFETGLCAGFVTLPITGPFIGVALMMWMIFTSEYSSTASPF